MKQDKPKAILFGAGDGGKNGFRYIRKKYQVLGFCDNDARKHGKTFCDLPIYAPAQLTELEYDVIIISSMYHKEIYDQLVTEMEIPFHKVEALDSRIVTGVTKAEIKLLAGCLGMAVLIVSCVVYAGYRLMMWIVS